MATSLNSKAPFGLRMRREGPARDPDRRPAAQPDGEAPPRPRSPRGRPPPPARAAPGWVAPPDWEPPEPRPEPEGAEVALAWPAEEPPPAVPPPVLPAPARLRPPNRAPPRQRYSWEVDRGCQTPAEAPCRAPPRQRYSWEVDQACQTEADAPASPPQRPPLFVPAPRRDGWAAARGAPGLPAAPPVSALAGRPFVVAGVGPVPAHELIIVVTTRPLPRNCALWWAPVRGGRFHLRSTCPGLGAAAAVSRILPTRLLTPCSICVGPTPVE